MRMKAVWASLLCIGVSACGTHREPSTPQLATLAVVAVDAETQAPIADALALTSAGGQGRTGADGYVAFDVPVGSVTYSVHASGYHDFVSDTVDVPGNVQLATPLSANRPSPPVGARHPDPVVGPLRLDADRGCVSDDHGCRHTPIVHMGDLFARFAHGHVDDVRQDLSDAAAEGYSVVRVWWNLNRGVWTNGTYPGLMPAIAGKDAMPADGSYEDQGVAFLQLVASYGMRATVEPGGLDAMSSAQERALFEALRRIVDRAGAWTVAGVGAVNEPSSVHGTSDDNGDVEPGYLRALVRIVTDGTSILWWLGHAHNIAWDEASNRFSQKAYTHPDQPIGWYHAFRGGHVDDKIRNRFSWIAEAPGHYKRLWWDGEGTGLPTSGPPLRHVSAVEHGHEQDDEALALIVAIQSLRGAGSHMSGNGVQRYQRFTETVGWRSIPWTVRQLPRDVHTFRTITHGGRGDAVIRAGHDQHGHLCRADQLLHDDGRVAAVLYVDADRIEDATCRFPVGRHVSGTLANPRDRTTTSVSTDGELVVGMRWGRVFSGTTH